MTHGISPPFYTHNGRYLMCLSVDANGVLNGSNTHISVAARPFRGAVTFSVLNQ